MLRSTLVMMVCLAALASANDVDGGMSSRRLRSFYSTRRFIATPRPRDVQQVAEASVRAPQLPASCACAADGVSAGISTGRLGCQRHVVKEGIGMFCMVVGGQQCNLAHPSFAFPGAAWIACSVPNRPTQNLHPCRCSDNGISGGVMTGRGGCQRHLKDTESFCYVAGGTQCYAAKTSLEFPGASWRDCGRP